MVACGDGVKMEIRNLFEDRLSMTPGNSKLKSAYDRFIGIKNPVPIQCVELGIILIEKNLDLDAVESKLLIMER
jgi:hypothetical protein